MADSWEEEETNVTPKPPKPPKQENQKCLASKCEEVRQDKHRWCPNHKRQAEAIVYQASKANKQAECKEIMQDDSSAQAAMEEFEAAMVPQKWFRRSCTWVEDDEDDV